MKYMKQKDNNQEESRHNTGHLHQLEGKALMKDAVDLRSTRQVGGVHLISRSFNALLKVHPKLLHHPADCTQHTRNVLTELL